VHALRQVDRALVPGGVLLDMHPVPPSARAELSGTLLGEFDDGEFMAIVAAAEGALESTGLFAYESESHFEYRERYDDASELLQDIEEGWEGCRVPAALEARIRAAGGPVDIWERVVLRRFSSRSRG
jgi:hypothetical protein